jgi:hypothetical protein
VGTYIDCLRLKKQLHTNKNTLFELELFFKSSKELLSPDHLVSFGRLAHNTTMEVSSFQISTYLPFNHQPCLVELFAEGQNFRCAVLCRSAKMPEEN